MRLDGLGEGVENGHPGVERGVGVLENHLKVGSRLAQERAAQGGQMTALENDGARCGPDELQEGASKSGFTAAGFANQSKDFTLPQIKGNAIDGAHQADAPSDDESSLDRKVGGEVLHAQKRRGGIFRRGHI